MTADFSIFFKKRNFYLFSFCVIDCIFLLCLTAVVFISMNIDSDVGEKYIISASVAYLIGALLLLPLLQKMMVYVPICGIISSGKKLKQLFSENAHLVYETAKIHQLDMTELDKTFDECESFQDQILTPQVIGWHKEITAWIEQNKEKIDKLSYIKLSAKQADIGFHIAQFIHYALRFYDTYDKYVAKDKYAVVPPMLFSKEEIAAFREAQKNYKTGG